MACCADKARTVMWAMLQNLVEGSHIQFDYCQEYTYHLPKQVFTTHGDIMEFFEALYALYHGKSEKFIQCLQKIAAINATQP
jgi:hypothetical protein